MTEQWLIQDITKFLKHRNRVVLLDPTGQCRFILPILKDQKISILETDGSLSEKWLTTKEELLLRFEAETTLSDKQVLFYVTRPLDKLSFLFDYCFTHGCLDLSYPQDWLKKKIFSHTSLQVQLDNPMLLTVAKLGIGKDLAWWKKIVQNLEEVINLEEELLPFLASPESYLINKDPDTKRLFEEKIYELLGQPFMVKPAKTLADEVVKRLFEGLENNDVPQPLLNLYYKWADSATFRPSFESYSAGFKINSSGNPWNAHADHCFEKLDKLALVQISSNFRDKSFVNEKLAKLHPRIFSPKAKLFVPDWWQDVWLLFHVDTQPLSSLRNINDFVEYYTNTFSKVDRAIRNLYLEFLNSEEIIRPLQEYYESLNHLLLEAWFAFFPEYKSDQQGFLPNLLKSSKPQTAIIVGDGLRYEIADYIASVLEKQFKVEKQVMLADMPSETEHNMSALYVGNNEVLPIHKDREARLAATSGKPIVFLQLEDVHYGLSAEYLVLTYKDIDSTGEKLQQGAIKLFSEFESVLIAKITNLLKMGYQQVHLITDHGFVLTGLLEDSDKIEPNARGIKEVHERFIRTVDKQSNDDWLAFEIPYEKYKYVYAAKNHRPFKSKGVYGFSHGGFTPQEIIIPSFIFTRHKPSSSALDVKISNKGELGDVPSELFMIKLQPSKSAIDLFGSQRKVQIKLFAEGEAYQSSTIFEIEAGKEGYSIECSFNNNPVVQAVLLDAISQEQLDQVIIKKSNLRDLGGL
jgi:hypothetical protein